MSINIFGSSSKKQSSDNVDKNYVNQKFITLSTNLATKLDKIGDTLTVISIYQLTMLKKELLE